MRCGTAPVNRHWNSANSEEPQPRAPVNRHWKASAPRLACKDEAVDAGLCAAAKARPAEGSG